MARPCLYYAFYYAGFPKNSTMEFLRNGMLISFLIVFQYFLIEFVSFGPVCVLGPVWGFFVDLFAFRLRSRRIWDPRRAKAAARRAGHYGSICFLNWGLLRCFWPASFLVGFKFP